MVGWDQPCNRGPGEDSAWHMDGFMGPIVSSIFFSSLFSSKKQSFLRGQWLSPLTKRNLHNVKKDL